MAKTTASTKSVDLGKLQDEYTKALRSRNEAKTKRQAAERALASAQATETKAAKALESAEATLRGATKSVLAPTSEV